jgi:alpha-N-arabinofuranosidase
LLCAAGACHGDGRQTGTVAGAGASASPGAAGSGGAAGTLGASAQSGAGGASAGSAAAGAAGIGDAGAIDSRPPSPTNVCADDASSGSAPSTLTVDVSAAQQVIADGIFGVLMERLGRDINGGLYVGTGSNVPNTAGMRNDILEGFEQAGVGSIEWPGGCAANDYHWSPPDPSNDMGTDLYMQLTGMLGIEPYLAGPGTASAANESLSWLKYIQNNSAHPEWAVKYFKIGNEVWGCGGNQNEATYEANYKASYDVLSPPINGKKVALVAATGLIGNTTWLDTQLKNLAGKIDGIEVHDYVYHPNDIPCVGFSDAQYYTVVHAANEGQIGPRLTQISALLDKYDSAKRIKIFEDEWGDWLEPFDKASDGWLQQVTVMDAVSAAEHLHLFMAHADRVQMAGLAQAVNVIHSLFLTRKSDGVLVKTPTFYVFKLLLPHHRAGAKWAPHVLTSEHISANGASIPAISAGTSLDDTGAIHLSLVNVDLAGPRTLGVTISGGKDAYVITRAEIVTGEAKDTYNDFGQPEHVNIQKLAASSCTIAGKSLEVTLPAKSVVMLTLEAL